MTVFVEASPGSSGGHKRVASVALVLAIALVSALAAPYPAQAQTYSVLLSFDGYPTDGRFPSAGVVRDPAGNLYGTTQLGGRFGGGTLFKLDTIGRETVLDNFSAGKGGTYPCASLIMDTAGNLYGTTQYGGASNSGTVFKVTKTGRKTVLYSFSGGNDGGNPSAGLIMDAANNLYGTTTWAGASGSGTVFKVDASGNETVLYSFSGGKDGANPVAGVVLDPAGNLYGTTFGGGASHHGVVFKLDMTGVETVLHSFAGGKDGAELYGGVVRDTAGNLFGTTYAQGPHGYGTLFRLDPTGKETLLYSFKGKVDGANPSASLVLDATGNIYGTTFGGGAFGFGSIFKLDKVRKETVLYSFTGGSDGAWPYAGLMSDGAGHLYGTTLEGGTGCAGSGCGVVFELTP
jgi:uncharacterized repeat protein (TIGR03803 family)